MIIMWIILDIYMYGKRFFRLFFLYLQRNNIKLLYYGTSISNECSREKGPGVVRLVQDDARKD